MNIIIKSLFLIFFHFQLSFGRYVYYRFEDALMTCNLRTENGECSEWKMNGYMRGDSDKVREEEAHKCFPANSWILTNNGPIQMKDLTEQHQLLGYDHKTQEIIYSPFVTWFHFDKLNSYFFVKLYTMNGNTISISDYHNMAYYNETTENINYKFAIDIKIGDLIFDMNNNLDKVIMIDYVYKNGLYAPLTKSNNFFVSDKVDNFFLVHCYANVKNPLELEINFEKTFNFLNIFLSSDTDYKNVNSFIHPTIEYLRKIYSFYNFFYF